MVNGLVRGLSIFAYTGMFHMVAPVIRAFDAGLVDVARCINYKMLPAMAMETSPGGHIFLKRLFAAQGIFAGSHDREPLPKNWDAQASAEVDAMVAYSLRLMDEIEKTFPNISHCDAFPIPQDRPYLLR